MKKTNKIFSVILSILMVISIIPISASAATPTSGTCGENVTWEFDKSTGTLYFFGTGAMNNIYDSYRYIPWIDYFFDIENVVISEGIYTIVNYAFYNCDNLVNVTLPKTLTSIGNHTFEDCDGLTNITIPNSVIEIGDYAFSRCHSLTSVTIPNSVEEIGEEAFSYCTGLTSITISNSVTVIKFFTFLNCTNLTSVTIPNSVTTIIVSAFENCKSITDVYYSGTEEQWKQISIGLYNRNLTGANIHYNSTGADTHPYCPVVTLPTCTEQGYTTYICACGYSNDVVENYLDATGHSHTLEITTPATHLEDGVKTFTCACGDTYTETIDKITEHNHEAVVTPPTCTDRGLTTYTCECGDSYVDDYVDALGHTPANAVEENHVAPTCTENGSKDVVVYCSVCDEEISRETVTLDATGHTDNDGDGYCDADNELLDPSVECEHICHKEGILGFIWRIINVFNRLFSLNKTCDCGIVHY